MTRERLKTYLPNNNESYEYRQWVLWRNSVLGEAGKEFSGLTIKDLKETIEHYLAHQPCGIATNIEYGKIYKYTRINKFEEVK